ncbi:hypothetical protein Tco_1373179 [Tanacetum coccineum]
MFSIIYEHVHGIIYKNSKKEKRVMRHSEIHKFCDATLNKVLEGLRSFNNDVKYGYIQRDLTNDKVEYLKLFEEEIEVSQSNEKMEDVCEWKTTWTSKRTPRIIDPYGEIVRNGYHTKGRKTKSKRQTKHGMEKTVKDKAKSKPKSQEK